MQAVEQRVAAGEGGASGFAAVGGVSSLGNIQVKTITHTHPPHNFNTCVTYNVHCTI